MILVAIPEGPALKRKPTPPRRVGEEEKADADSEEQELVTVTKVVEEVRVCWSSFNFYVMFKTRAAVFYRDLKPRGAAEWF